MIDGRRLLTDLKWLRADLEADLRERCDDVPELEDFLRDEHRQAVEGGRTASRYAVWKEERLTQVAMAWILGCVFVRFLEDNGLVDPPRLSGSGERRGRVVDEYTRYFRAHPTGSDRDYLLHVFRAVAALPVAGQLFDEAHNPIWSLEQPGREFRAPSGDAAGRLLRLWRRIDRSSGSLVHDFTDRDWDTRFLGDLYQGLFGSAGEQYGLLPTAECVVAFILDRTLTPAIEAFGFREVRLIDPACGSGDFLLGAFRRLEALWAQHEPGSNPRERATRVLDQVAGVDLNPFAAAIARFRLCVAALYASGVLRLADAPAFELHVATGDSLLHGPRPDLSGARQEHRDPAHDPPGHVYRTEDAAALRAILGRRYHVVVGNPPYMTPRDRALDEGYRKRFGSCYRKYSLAVPFTERFFDLAHAPAPGSAEPAGFVGMITANEFAKREFGRKLVREFLRRRDLTHVVDTSGAYLPGHETPTVMLFGRHRPPPVDRGLRVVTGLRGEPSTPWDAAQGRVWSAIGEQIDAPGSHSEFVGVSDVPRESFRTHPWRIGGGVAAELKRLLDTGGTTPLGVLASSIGTASFTLDDDVYLLPPVAVRRLRLPAEHVRAMVVGDAIRDWAQQRVELAVFPYDAAFLPIPDDAEHPVLRYLWRARTSLANSRMFGGKTRTQTKTRTGLRWYEYGRLTVDKLQTPLSITFADVATHNHFVLDRGGRVFKRTAPVVKLSPDATEDDHLGLLGLLNSSTACFWMKQTFHNKGGGGIGGRPASESWEQLYAFDGTKLRKFPVTADRPPGLAGELDALAREWSRLLRLLPEASVARTTPTEEFLHTARSRAYEIRNRMIALQEELDWRCYRLYKVTNDDLCMPPGDLPAVHLGERAFEILLACKRHGLTSINQIPRDWPAAYRALVQGRIETIESNPYVALLEQRDYKRRWDDEPWEAQEKRALRGWLIDRLEAPALWTEPRLTTVVALADRLEEDDEFLQVAEMYTGWPVDVADLVARLVADESVPLLPALRYMPSGLRKRTAWERTWELQRREDAIDARAALPASDPEHLGAEAAAALKAAEIGTIPVPPRYAPADFRKGVWWRLRGKLDVPKERFVSLPGCERDADPSPVIGWAGWDALQQSRAIAAYLVQVREQDGWTVERLTPLLAALLELLPWVRQYHNVPDPESGTGMGDYFEGFINEEARALSLTREAIRAWAPPDRTGRRGGRRRAT